MKLGIFILGSIQKKPQPFTYKGDKMMCFFHKWTKWERHTKEGQRLIRFFVPDDMKGKYVPFTEERQSRTCLKCGRIQDELII